MSPHPFPIVQALSCCTYRVGGEFAKLLRTCLLKFANMLEFRPHVVLIMELGVHLVRGRTSFQPDPKQWSSLVNPRTLVWRASSQRPLLASCQRPGQELLLERSTRLRFRAQEIGLVFAAPNALLLGSTIMPLIVPIAGITARFNTQP